MNVANSDKIITRNAAMIRPLYQYYVGNMTRRASRGGEGIRAGSIFQSSAAGGRKSLLERETDASAKSSRKFQTVKNIFIEVKFLTIFQLFKGSHAGEASGDSQAQQGQKTHTIRNHGHEDGTGDGRILI